jgi:hypothetical protein
MKEKPDVLQGTLALMVLKTLDVPGSQHGYDAPNPPLRSVTPPGSMGPSFRKAAQDVVEGEHEGSIVSRWGASEKNRRARSYRLAVTGRKQLQTETRDRNQTAAIIGRFFEMKAEDLA